MDARLLRRGYNPLHISSPISLDANQTWTSISSSGGEWGSEPVLEVSGPISGEASSLTIDLKSQRALIIGEFGEGPNANDEVGDATVNGTEGIDPLTGLRAKTRVELGPADFNGRDKNRLTVDDVALQNRASTGPITAINSTVAVIGGGIGPLTSVSSRIESVGIAYLPSAIFDAGSSLDFSVEATTEPAVQYNELNATGLVSLGGSELDLGGSPGTGFAVTTSLVTSLPAVVGPVTAAQLEASLGRQLIPLDNTVKIGRLTAAGYVLMSFTALEAGSVSVYWYDLPAGAKLDAAKVKPVLVASG